MKSSRSRSSANRNSARNFSRGLRSSNPIHTSDDPISVFSSTISKIPPDEWKAKTKALEHLMEEITSALKVEQQTSPNKNIGNEFEEMSLSSNISRVTSASASSKSIVNGNGTNFLQSKALRTLSFPFRALLSDLRALVVKAACATLSTMSELLQSRMSLLLKDVLPTMLAIHSQTAKVMHGYAQTAMATILSYTKNSKPVIGNLLTEIKINKSKDVRCVGIFYLDVILSHWNNSFFLGSITVNNRSSNSSSSSARSNPYTEKPLYHMIGYQLLKSIVDPSQLVRIQARESFMNTFRRKLPREFELVMNDPYGPLAKNARLKKSVMTQAKQEAHLFQNADIKNDTEKNMHLNAVKSSSNSLTPSYPKKSTSLSAVTASPSYLNPTKSSQRLLKARNLTRTNRTTRSSDTSTPSSTRISNIQTPQKSTTSSPSTPSTAIKNPFSLSFSPSPKPKSKPTSSKHKIDDDHLLQVQNRIRIQSKLKHESISLIQAAVRGMLTRKRVLRMLEKRIEKDLEEVDKELELSFPETFQKGSPKEGKRYDIENDGIDQMEDSHKTKKVGENGSSSPEISMLREARRALAKHRYNNDLFASEPDTKLYELENESSEKQDTAMDTSIPTKSSRRESRLGMTAKEMAIRRRTAGKIEILPLPPSPDAIYAASPTNLDRRIEPYEASSTIESSSTAILNENGNDKSPTASQRESMLFTPHASASKYRRPKLMRKSSIQLKNRLHQQLTTPKKKTSPIEPLSTGETLQTSHELTSISEDLLAAHKRHIDEIMEILNEEMMIAKAFEEHVNSDNVGEDDVIDYFEGVSACLDQRAEVGDTLKSAMDKISQG